jgi:hypothetical protein
MMFLSENELLKPAPAVSVATARAVFGKLGRMPGIKFLDFGQTFLQKTMGF